MNIVKTNTFSYTTMENSISSTTTSKKENKKEAATSNKEETVVYDTDSTKENDSTKQIYKPNTDLINQLKKDTEQRTAQLKSLVEKMLLKQGQTITDQLNIFQLIKDGKLSVDEDTAKQAEQDISEDGYWGVKQTSDRLVSFAIALTGGDTSKADLMLSAMEDGFKQAEEIWGDDLPEICRKTLEAAKEKLNKWKNGELTAEDASETTEIETNTP